MILESVAAAVLIAGGNYADYSSTRSAIARGGIEANGIYGPQAERMAPIKIGVVAAETAVFVALHKKRPLYGWLWVGVIVGGNLALAHHNDQVRPR